MAQSWRSIDIRTLHRELAFFVAGENSIVTDTGCVPHCDAIDTTTLSPECQQPCQPNPISIAEAMESVAQQRFSQHRRTLEEICSTRVPRPSRLAAKDPPTLRQSFANSAPRVRCDDHTREPGRRRDERPVINPPTGRRPTGTRSKRNSLAGRPRRTLSPECQQPSHQSVSSPPTAGQRQRPRTRECPTAGYTRKKRTSKWRRNETLMRGLSRMIRP